MATILSCGVCHYPFTFRNIAPDTLGEVDFEVGCPRCGALYSLTVKMTKGPTNPEKVEDIKNKPSS